MTGQKITAQDGGNGKTVGKTGRRQASRLSGGFIALRPGRFCNREKETEKG